MSKKGVVKCKKAGKVTITVTSAKNKKLKKKINYTVIKKQNPTVTLDKKTMSLPKDGVYTLTPTLKGVDGDQKWTSSDKNVADVDDKGTVTAKGIGSTTISVTVGAGKGVSASCQVTVEDYHMMSISELKDIIVNSKAGWTVLDVRREKSYIDGYVMGSVSADVDSAVNNNDDPAIANLKKAIKGKDKNEKYVLICYSGVKYAQNATRLLAGLGIDHKNVYTLEGGIGAWNKGGEEYTSLVVTDTQYITKEDLKKIIDNKEQNVTILDVRRAESIPDGYLIGSKFADCEAAIDGPGPGDATATANLKAAISNPEDTEMRYILVCYSGNKFAKAANRLMIKELNIANSQIYTLQGGFTEWAATDGYQVYIEK